MSGVIPASFKTIELVSLDAAITDQIVRLHFPDRVKITSVSFCVTDTLLNYPPSGGVWYLQGTKYRRPRPDTGMAFADMYAASCNIWEGADPTLAGAPYLLTDNGTSGTPLSTIATLPDKGTWYPNIGLDTFVDDVAQMDPDEWIELYFTGVPGRPLGGDVSPGRATITVAYEGATNLD